jgi:hypothetical protein
MAPSFGKKIKISKVPINVESEKMMTSLYLHVFLYYRYPSKNGCLRLAQRRQIQAGLWAADQLFSHDLGRNLSKTKISDF